MGFLDEKRTGAIPLAHTSFSWNPPPAASAPLSHTAYSWGTGSPTVGDISALRRYRILPQPKQPEESVKKGFLLDSARPTTVPEDADEFVLQGAQRVLERVEELHAQECEENNPFRAKYEARSLLKTLMKQLEAAEGMGTTSSFEQERPALPQRG
jgi:hypothetical protein